MVSTDTKFFTNEPHNTLYERFAAIFESNTQFFDVLVGYFRSSGFFKMYNSMESVEHIRILVGLNVDKRTVDFIDMANEEYEILPISTKQAKDILEDEVVQEFDEAPSTAEVEQGVRVFIDWLKNGKLEMRMYTEAPIHAKVYIMRKNPDIVKDQFGTVITGSSNFSTAGLQNNLEFNVELKDYSDVKFALDHFELLWKDGVDISKDYIDILEKKTWIRGDITPYQLFLKALYEFFKETINDDKESNDGLIPPGLPYMHLRYQEEAVKMARDKLEAYNGVFISDVVGLGKTNICAMLARTLPRVSKKLFICPPVLMKQWEDTLDEFEVLHWKVESLGKLESLIKDGVEKYDYIFVDEAHRFRNSDTNNYTYLHQICSGKKVILISATPINNYTSDIENQIYLFQAKQNGTINGIKNLEGFFGTMKGKLKQYEKGTPEYKNQLRRNSELIREKLLRDIMIRRTRGDIKAYYEDDIKTQGLTFPAVGDPTREEYIFDEATDEAFNETIKYIKEFHYSRYTPLLYLKDTEKYASLLVSQRNMGGFMKGVLVKRLESSFHAFRMTLDRFVESYEKFIDMYESGDVYISKKVDVYDLMDETDIVKMAKLEYYIEQEDVMHFKSTEFKAGFIHDLKSDLLQLYAMRDLWAPITSDPKLDKFRSVLSEDSNMTGHKVLVFTESKETADYLYDNLKDMYKGRAVLFSGESSQHLREEIEDSFNPRNKDKNNDKYDLLITTDVLAEGINLHRSNVIVNYDLPWNPTRIMQRVGRINRVGTEFDRIYVYNFFPTSQSSKQMPLEDRIFEKIQLFHDTLGEDMKYLTDKEDTGSRDLYGNLTHPGDDEDEVTPELEYLKIIRDVRDNDAELFEYIKSLPKKAKAGKHYDVDKSSTVSFIRKGALKSFFIANDDFSEQVSFLDAMKYIKSDKDCKTAHIGADYFEHVNANSKAFDKMLEAEIIVSTEKPKLTGNTAKIVNLLRAFQSCSTFTDEQLKAINMMIDLWTNGQLSDGISKSILKRVKYMTDPVQMFYEFVSEIPETYMKSGSLETTRSNEKKEIVLSCYLNAEV